jgi:hypothetical protein
MFSDIVTTPAANALLVALWLLWAGLLFGGFLFGRYDAQTERWKPVWTRIGSSFALVLAAWCWVLLARPQGARSFALLIAIGMTFGFVGDLFMAKLLPGSQPVVGGMAAFGLGHVAYIAAALSAGALLGLTDVGSRRLAWVAWLLVGLLSWYFVAYRRREVSLLNWLALPYSLLLASTAGAATGLALQAPLFWPFAVGAALFLLGDFILAAGLFGHGPRRSFSDALIWLTYGPGQMLIVYGVAGAMLAASR